MLGTALCVCTLSAQTLFAQATTADTVAKKAPADSEIKQRPDSVQSRIGRETAMPTLDIGTQYTFTRDAMFATGAYSLSDLLERIPGLTTFQSGWLPAPHLAAYGGDFGRVRVFMDGIELDKLDPRMGGMLDLRSVPLASLEEVSLVRGANELRIDVHTWQYNLTAPYTRTDIITGDLKTNLYRAYYGKRFYNGSGMQVVVQQYGVTNPREGGGGDQLALFGRYGIGKKWWSADVTVNRVSNNRTITQRFGNDGVYLPDYRARNTVAYLRVGIGKAGDGPFLQLVASSLGLRENSPHFTPAQAAIYYFVADTADTTVSQSQYIATAGWDKSGVRLRLINRYRVQNGSRYDAGMATLDVTQQFVSFNALAEKDPYSGFTRLEGGARLQPLPFLAVSAVAGTRQADPAHTAQPDSRSARIEAGIRPLGRIGPWISGGVVTRDTSILIEPLVFDTVFRARPVGRTTGTIASIRGPLAYGVSVEAAGTHWTDPTVYTPKYQVYGELRYATNLLSKFPSGNFSFVAAPRVEYRSRVSFPTANNDISAAAAHVYSIVLELRILRGVITYQRRNFTDRVYDQVPGFIMPRALNVYGVRWYFFN